MNDTVYAQIQLNGADNITSARKPALKDVSGLVAREPYVYMQSSYAYMYIGVSEGKAVDLRVKDADQAVCSAKLNTALVDNGTGTEVYIGRQGNSTQTIFWIYGHGELTTPGNERQYASIAIHNDKIVGSSPRETTIGTDRPRLQGFNIDLTANCYINSYSDVPETNRGIKNVALSNISRLSLHRNSTNNSDNRGYGTALPTSAEVGEVFFLITE